MRAIENRVHQSIEELGLCASDFGVLEALLHKGALPVNVLGKKLLLTSGSITTAVDRLARRGLVERRDDPEDRRVRIVDLTPKGRRLIVPAFARHAGDLERVFGTLSRTDRAKLADLLRAVGTHAESADNSVIDRINDSQFSRRNNRKRAISKNISADS